MFRLLLILLFVTVASCSKHDVSLKVSGLDQVPDSFEFGPDFERAAKFCDDRYLPDVEAAEACFEDYRNYFRLEISFDLESVVSFCEAEYGEQTDSSSECIDDLFRLFDSLPQSSGGSDE